MKKISFLLVFAAILLTLGCNSSDNGVKGDNITIDSANLHSPGEDVAVGAPAPEDKEALAVAELCPCVNTSLANMSPKVKRIIMDAGKNPNPVRVLTTELQKINNAEEQARLTNELERFQYDPVLQECSENLRKKYNLDENNPRTREKLFKAAERNKECELVYALMRIAEAQEKNDSPPGR